MAVDGVFPALAIRSSLGIELWASSGPMLPFEHKSNLPREETKHSRSISFSADGRFFAYSNGHEVKILQTNDWQLKCTLPRPKAFYLKFSPCGNYICTWELYVITKDIPEGSPNMFVYETCSGTEVFSIVQKKQTDWEPSWSADETIFAIVVGGEALFYDLSQGAQGFASVTSKIDGMRGGVLSVSPGNSPPNVAFYTVGAKGAPSMCKIYKYPTLSQNQAVACKSFFADRVEMLWNKRGTGLLLLSSTEVDKSGASYYGNQALHFLATKGDSCSVPMAKKGPVHCVKWSPKATEFVVVYGYMPSMAALYNLKCDVIFDFGSGPRNCAYFNPFGNLVVLAGFGNLPGNVEIWDIKTKEMISNIKCPDTTHFDWSPNGEYFVTATTAPRLRIGNGFKIYHYSGALMHETIWPKGQELLSVEWQQFAENTFTEPIITKMKQEGIKSSQPEASKKVYTPPHLRGDIESNKLIIQSCNSIPGLTSTTTTGNSASKMNSNNNTNNNNNSNNNKKHGSQKYQFHQHEARKGGGSGGGNSKQSKVKKANQNIANNNSTNTSQHAVPTPLARNSSGASNNELIKPVSNDDTNGNGIVKGGEPQSHQQQPKQQQQQRPRQPRKRHNNQRRSQQQHQLQQQPQEHDVTSIVENDIDKNSYNTQQQQAQSEHQKHEEPLIQIAETITATADAIVKQNVEPNSKKAPNSEKSRKIRIVAQKLSDIKKLKARRDEGQILELNQLNKISMEAKFLEELKALKLSS